jgi:hypothetical protein
VVAAGGGAEVHGGFEFAEGRRGHRALGQADLPGLLGVEGEEAEDDERAAGRLADRLALVGEEGDEVVGPGEAAFADGVGADEAAVADGVRRVARRSASPTLKARRNRTSQ